MSNQLAVVQPQGTAVATAAEFSIRDMERMAVAFAQSGLFGVKTPDQALALCLIAHAEGRHPALAARDYDIIQGRPAKKAEAMLRDFLSAGGKVEWHELTDTRADATFSHPAGGTIRVDWDMERAKQAALGGKDNWKKFPRQMLRSRVVSEGVRSVFPNATSGMYVPEEVRDFADDAPAKPAMPQPKRARDLKAEPAPDPEQPKAAKQTAEEWTDEHIAAVAAVPGLTSLEELQVKAQRAVEKLKADRPDLHERVLKAYQAKVGDLAPPVEDDAGEWTADE